MLFRSRVSIGQVLLSVRCKDNSSQHAQEALRRAKFKFPGRQKIIVSRKWYAAVFIICFEVLILVFIFLYNYITLISQIYLVCFIDFRL